MRIFLISIIFVFSLSAKEGFDREDCQWQSRDLRTMAFRLKNISWDIERRCRKSTASGKKTCEQYIQYFEQLLEDLNKQYKVAKTRCMK
jgi:hypothetical protein